MLVKLNLFSETFDWISRQRNSQKGIIWMIQFVRFTWLRNQRSFVRNCSFDSALGLWYFRPLNFFRTNPVSKSTRMRISIAALIEIPVSTKTLPCEQPLELSEGTENTSRGEAFPFDAAQCFSQNSEFFFGPFLHRTRIQLQSLTRLGHLRPERLRPHFILYKRISK